MGTRWLVVVWALGLASCGSTAAPTDGAASDGPVDRLCVDDRDCDDGVFCDGTERCRPGIAAADARGCAGAIDVTPCLANQSCDEAAGACVTDCEVVRDADADGELAIPCGGRDCDDARGDVHPGGTEVCDLDGADEDCDPATYGARDTDGDAIDDALCCNVSGAVRTCGEDCDDTRRETRPGADEVCNARDDDCDGTIDEGVTATGFEDADGDRHGATDAPRTACVGAAHFSPLGDDCDDLDPRRHPSQGEVCDRLDNDCDGTVDEAARSLTWYRDGDGDGFGNARGGTVASCEPVVGYSLLHTDCDDARADVSPVAIEACDGIDDDCNAAADALIAPGDFEDDDGDGAPDARCAAAVRDCDDRDPYAYPGAEEICDLRDGDCDGTIDEGSVELDWLLDGDGDRWGGTDVARSCAPIPGRVTRDGDCDDARATVHPGAPDGCGGVIGDDEDCDGATDEDAILVASYADGDGDGFGAGAPSVACTVPADRGADPGDCDDADGARGPGTIEACSLGIDDDCDGTIDCADPDCAPSVTCTGTGVGSLSLIAGPSPAIATIVRPLDAPVRVRVLDGLGAPVAGATVRITAPPGALAQPSTARTSVAGEVSVTLYVGRRVGAYDFTFSSDGVPDLVFRASATAPAAGSTVLLLGSIAVADGSVLPSPALATRFDVLGVAYLADGSIAVSGRGCVMRIDPDGELRRFVGVCRAVGSTAIPAGDGGPSIDAVLAAPGPLAFDPAGGVLYVADVAAGQVRAADLASGRISTIATGLAAIEDLDAGPDGAAYITVAGGVLRATAAGVASFARPVSLALGPDAYLSSATHGATFTPTGEMVMASLQRCRDGGPELGGLVIALRTGPTTYDDPAPILGTGCRDAAGPPASVGVIHASRVTGNLFRATDGSLRTDLLVTGGDTRASALLASPRQIDARGGDVAIAAGPRVVVLVGQDLPLDVNAIRTSMPSYDGAIGVPTETTSACGPPDCDCHTDEYPRYYPIARPVGGGGVGGAAGNFPCASPHASTIGVVAGSPGTHTFELGFRTIYETPALPTTFTVAATAPAAGTATALTESQYAAVTYRASSLLASGNAVSDVAVASDGRLYLVAQSSRAHPAWLQGVYRVELDRSLVPIAGLVSAASGAGDGGPAIGAAFGVGGAMAIALDEASGTIFVNDASTAGEGFVRAVDLATGTIAAYAGGGASTADGTPRTAAHLDPGIRHLRIDPSDRSLWIGSPAGLRRIDRATGTVTTPVPFVASCAAAAALVGCGTGAESCDVAFAADGTLYVSGRVCAPGCGAVPGVLRMPVAGTPEVALGGCTGSPYWSWPANEIVLRGAPGSITVLGDGTLAAAVLLVTGGVVVQVGAPTDPGVQYFGGGPYRGARAVSIYEAGWDTAPTQVIPVSDGLFVVEGGMLWRSWQ